MRAPMPQATPPSTKGPFGTQQTTRGVSGDADSDDGTHSNGGTRQLLRGGFGIFAVGVMAALLTKTVFGGIGQHGPHTDSGWLALIIALMCLPFGLLLTALGSAKWLRDRRIAKRELGERNR
jgi:hypothetical protein